VELKILKFFGANEHMSIFSPHNSNKSIITTCIAKYENAIKMILAYLHYLPLSKGLPSLG
jgi:hypothetical protein